MKRNIETVKKLLSLNSTMAHNNKLLTADIKLASNQGDFAQKVKAQGRERYSEEKIASHY